MITERAKASFERLLLTSLKNGGTVTPTGPRAPDLDHGDDRHGPRAGAEEHLTAPLTADARALVILHMCPD